jgi:hypothetical protein
MPRHQNAQTPLFNDRGEHIRYVSKRDAQQLVSTGEAIEICRQCQRYGEDLKAKKYCGAHQKPHAAVFMVTALYKPHRTSSATISLGEMLANVGLSRKDERDHGISDSFARAARQKVTAYGTLNYLFLKELTVTV